MNLGTNAFGLLSTAVNGGKISFNLKHLTPVYESNWFASNITSRGTIAIGPYTIHGMNPLTPADINHESHHIWQSRYSGNWFLPNYFQQWLYSSLNGNDGFSESNYYETPAYNSWWFR